MASGPSSFPLREGFRFPGFCSWIMNSVFFPPTKKAAHEELPSLRSWALLFGNRGGVHARAREHRVVAVDRTTQKRTPKPSLAFLGSYTE